MPFDGVEPFDWPPQDWHPTPLRVWRRLAVLVGTMVVSVLAYAVVVLILVGMVS